MSIKQLSTNRGGILVQSVLDSLFLSLFASTLLPGLLLCLGQLFFVFGILFTLICILADSGSRLRFFAQECRWNWGVIFLCIALSMISLFLEITCFVCFLVSGFCACECYLTACFVVSTLARAFHRRAGGKRFPQIETGAPSARVGFGVNEEPVRNWQPRMGPYTPSRDLSLPAEEEPKPNQRFTAPNTFRPAAPRVYDEKSKPNWPFPRRNSSRPAAPRVNDEKPEPNWPFLSPNSPRPAAPRANDEKTKPNWPFPRRNPFRKAAPRVNDEKPEPNRPFPRPNPFRKASSQVNEEPNSNRPPLPKGEQVFHWAFPNSPRIIPTPGDGLCGLHAIRSSLRAQAPHLPVPSVEELLAVLDRDDEDNRRIAEAIDGSRHRGAVREPDAYDSNRTWFLQDHLAAIFYLWGRGRGLDVALGIWTQNRGYRVHDSDSTRLDTPIIWIHHNGFNHYSGLRANQGGAFF